MHIFWTYIPSILLSFWQNLFLKMLWMTFREVYSFKFVMSRRRADSTYDFSQGIKIDQTGTLIGHHWSDWLINVYTRWYAILLPKKSSRFQCEEGSTRISFKKLRLVKLCGDSIKYSQNLSCSKPMMKLQHVPNINIRLSMIS